MSTATPVLSPTEISSPTGDTDLESDRPWIVTYDMAAVREELFPRHRRMVYSLSYSAQNRYKAKEVMFFSERLALPDDWKPRKRLLLSPAGARHAVYGRLQEAKSHVCPSGRLNTRPKRQRTRIAKG